MIPRWAARVTFGNVHYDEKPAFVIVEASTLTAAVNRAVRQARGKLPKGTRIGRASVTLTRLRTPGDPQRPA